MKLLTATIQGSPRSVQTRFGARLVLDCVAETGEKLAIWRNPGDAELLSRRDGERITVGIDSKNKAHLMASLSSGLVDSTTNGNGNGHKNDTNGNGSRASEIRDYVERLSKLYSFCYRTVKDEFNSDDLETPQLKDVASCLFIQTIRKFDL